MFKFSRSHQNSLHQCPRLAFLRYYAGANGKGWDTKRINVAQSTGSLLHSIITSLALQVKETDSIPLNGDVDRAVQAAIATYRAEAMQRGFDIEQQGDMEFELQRQSMLAEGMARGWLLVRLPKLLEKYKVVAVEEEWEIPLSDAVVCLVRIDMVLEERETGELWALEMKTTGWMDDSWLEKWRYDSQTLMHAWAIEKRFPDKVVGGVIVEAFYKGTKRKGDDGRDTYYSPYLRAYKSSGVGPFSEDQWSYDSSMSRKKGWEVADALAFNDEARWVAQMPPEIIQGQLYEIEVFRNPKEQDIWERQTLLEQGGVADALQQLSLGNEVYMDGTFAARMNADCYSNKYRKRCSFLQVCFSGIDPAESDEFMERIPHHTGEFDE